MSKRVPKGLIKRPDELSEEERSAREPVFDAFGEGVAPGGLRSKTDIRLLILFLLEQLDAPVPVRILSDVITDRELANYFEAMDAIIELKETGNLEMVSVDGQECVAITEKGTGAVSYVEEDLPKSVRETALATAQRFLRLDRHAKENTVEITPEGDGYNVCFSLKTGDTRLMELNMYVVSREQAELLKEHYLEDPAHLYSGILTALMLD